MCVYIHGCVFQDPMRLDIAKEEIEADPNPEGGSDPFPQPLNEESQAAQDAEGVDPVTSAARRQSDEEGHGVRPLQADSGGSGGCDPASSSSGLAAASGSAVQPVT